MAKAKEGPVTADELAELEVILAHVKAGYPPAEAAERAAAEMELNTKAVKRGK